MIRDTRQGTSIRPLHGEAAPDVKFRNLAKREMFDSVPQGDFPHTQFSEVTAYHVIVIVSQCKAVISITFPALFINSIIGVC